MALLERTEIPAATGEVLMRTDVREEVAVEILMVVVRNLMADAENLKVGVAEALVMVGVAEDLVMVGAPGVLVMVGVVEGSVGEEGITTDVIVPLMWKTRAIFPLLVLVEANDCFV